MKVVQCWDDGVVDDIRLVEILRKYHARATFNLNPGVGAPDKAVTTWTYQGTYPVYRLARNDWRSLYDGFCVASHGMRHQRPDECELAVFMADAVDARKYLEDLFQRECPGYAWPCGATTPESVAAMKEAGFAYGRTTRYTDHVTGYADPLMLNTNCHFLDPDFEAKLTAAKERGEEFFYFWGHAYETVGDEAIWNLLESRIAAVTNDPELQWADVIDIFRPGKE